MRIAIFTNAYQPITSGVVVSIQSLKDAYIRAGHEVYIFAPEFPDHTDSEPNIFRFKSVELTRKVEFPIAIPFSNDARKCLLEFNPDIIHAHHPFVLGQVAYRYAHKLDVPIVFTFHTEYDIYTDLIPLPGELVKYSCNKLVRDFAEKVDCVTTPSRSKIDVLRSYGITNRIEVITNALDCTPFDRVTDEEIQQLRTTYGVGEHPVVLYLGRVAPEKNLHFLVDAFRLLLAQKPDTYLLIGGDGPARTDLEDYVQEYGLTERVRFLGNIRYSDVPKFYKMANAFAFPSLNENKPFVIIEAMAAGVPIVAVNVPWAADAMKTGTDGLLTDPEPQAFADGLLRTLEEKELVERLKTGMKTTAEQFSIEKVSQNILRLYQELIDVKTAERAKEKAE